MQAKLKALEAELARVVEINKRAVQAVNQSHAQAQQLQAQIDVVRELIGPGKKSKRGDQ